MRFPPKKLAFSKKQLSLTTKASEKVPYDGVSIMESLSYIHDLIHKIVVPDSPPLNTSCHFEQ